MFNEFYEDYWRREPCGWKEAATLYKLPPLEKKLLK